MIKSIYPQIIALMSCRGITVKDVAKAIDKNPDTIRKKIAGISPFNINEAMLISDKVFSDVPFKILFSKDIVDIK